MSLRLPPVKCAAAARPDPTLSSEERSDVQEGRRGHHRRRRDRRRDRLRTRPQGLQDPQHRQAAGRGLRPHERVVRHRARALLLVGRRRDGLRGLLLLEGLGELPRRRGRVRPREVHELRHAAARERDRPPREGPRPLPRRRRRVRGVDDRPAARAHADLRPARVLSAQAPRGPALLGPVRGRAPRRDLHAGLAATSTTRSWRRTTSSGPPRRTAASSSSAPTVAEIRAPQRPGHGGHAERRASRSTRRSSSTSPARTRTSSTRWPATTHMSSRTKPLRHEVHHVPAPPDFDYGRERHPLLGDGDTGIYFRPETATTS